VEEEFRMKYAALGFNLFCRNIILNLILILQLTVSLVLINMTLGQVNAQRLTLGYFENIAREKGAYFMPSIEDLLAMRVDTIDTAERYSVLDELTNVKTISAVYQYAFYTDGNKNNLFEGYGYDGYISETVKFPLSKGVWYTDLAVEEGIVPVVVSSEKDGLALGQTIPVKIHHPSPGKATVQLKVVGIMRPPPYLLHYTVSGNIISGNDIFERYNESYQGAPLIMFSRDALAEYQDYYYARNNNTLVFFDENISEADYRRNIETLSNRGFVQTIDKMYILARQEINDNMNAMLPFIICTLSISTVGLVSLTILNTILQRKVFAIYYLCGSKWKNCFYILLAYLLVVTLLSLVLLLVLFYLAVLNGTVYTMGLYISLNNVLTTLGVYLAVMFLSLIVPYVILKNTFPIEIIRGN
jgi:hypothetical protein